MACRKLSEPQLHSYYQNADDVLARDALHIIDQLGKAFSGK